MDDARSAEGARYFEQLKREYPQSGFLADVPIQLGDYYFNSAEWQKSERQYDDALAHSQSSPRVGPYAIYKKAWCRYNQDDPRGALLLFKRAISLEGRLPKSGGMRIRSEALKDIALPFVDLGLRDESIQFYRALGEPLAHQGLESMASLY